MAFHERDQAVTIVTPLLSSNAQSSNFNTNGYNIQSWSKYALQVVTTNQSSLNVAAKVQATVNGTDWADVPGSTQTLTTNTTFIWDYGGGSSVIAVRVAFTFTGGSANFQVWAFAKL